MVTNSPIFKHSPIGLLHAGQSTLKPPGITRYYSHIYTKSFLPFAFVYTYLPRVLPSRPSHRAAKIPRTGQ